MTVPRPAAEEARLEASVGRLEVLVAELLVIARRLAEEAEDR